MGGVSIHRLSRYLARGRGVLPVSGSDHRPRWHLDQERPRAAPGLAGITQVVIFGERGGRVRVGIRARPGAIPTRPWGRVSEFLGRLLPEWRLRAPGRDRPFALIFESACTDRSAHELADRFRAVAPVPVTEPGTDDREPYAVQARFVSVLPLAAFFLAWNGVLAPAWSIDMIHEYPHALVPLVVVGVGVNLIMIDLLIPGMALTADGVGLRIGGEFLAWSEIRAIDVALARNDTELTVTTVGSTALVEAEVRRRLSGVRVDPARLAAVAPSHVAINLIAQSQPSRNRAHDTGSKPCSSGRAYRPGSC